MISQSDYIRYSSIIEGFYDLAQKYYGEKNSKEFAEEFSDFTYNYYYDSKIEKECLTRQQQIIDIPFCRMCIKQLLSQITTAYIVYSENRELLRLFDIIFSRHKKLFTEILILFFVYVQIKDNATGINPERRIQVI